MKLKRLARQFSKPEVAKELSKVSVFVCTLDALSSPVLGVAQTALLQQRPIRYLVVDEASQILLAAYPHLVSRHRDVIGRIALFGDDAQLGPYGEEKSPLIRSVFRLPHLTNNALMLKTSYRLPAGLCKFVSGAVYWNQLESHKGDGPLGDAVH